MNRQGMATLLWLSTLCCVAGCLSAPDGDEERLEHQVPAHKPPALSAAVAELERRNPSASNPSQGAEQLDGADSRSELQDIIGWLPELAADTDLKKADWEAVQRLSGELAALVARHDEHPASNDGFAAGYQRIIEQLREIADQLNDAPFERSIGDQTTHDEQTPSPVTGGLKGS